MDSVYLIGIALNVAFWIVIPTLITAALIWPPWFYARRYHGASVWSLLVLSPSLLVWFVMVYIGVAPDDYAALIGTLYLAAATVFFYYIKAFILDKIHKLYKHSTYAIVGLSCVFAVVLSFIMPPIYC